MKKIMKMTFVLSLVLMLSACSTVVAQKREDHSNKTLTGEISEINDTTLTLELGKLKKADKEEAAQDSEGQVPQFNDGEMPERPEGEMPQEADGERPELPEGFSDQMPQGEQGQMMHGHGPKAQDGERPEMPEDFDGQRPEMPEDFEGQMPEGDPGTMNGADGFMPGMNENKKGKTEYTFNKKSGTATIDIKGVEVTLADGSIGTADDLQVGDVVKIVVDENNDVSSVTVYQVTGEIVA